jgi:hypothetical protein
VADPLAQAGVGEWIVLSTHGISGGVDLDRRLQRLQFGSWLNKFTGQFFELPNHVLLITRRFEK